MPLFHLLPAVLALLVLAAHFFRADLPFLVPVCVGFAALLFVRFAWVPRTVGLALVLAAGEWLHTLAILVGDRLEAGQPWLRLALILSGVALATLLAAWLLNIEPVRRWYRAAA